MKKILTLMALLGAISLCHAQHNFTTGLTTLTNPSPNARTLEIREDDQDGFVTFHDPGNRWFTMGLQHSTGLFKVHYGGDLNANTHFTMSSIGNVGIGATPSARLDIMGQTFTQAITDKVVALRLKNIYNGPGRHFKNSAADLVLSRWEAGGNHRPETQLDFRLAGNASETYDDHIPNVDVMTLRSNGYVGIGTTSPSEKLEVDGNARIVGDIYSKKVKVTANASNWPDYVFESDYDLTSLSDLEAFIKTNKHLPEVPAATIVENHGQDLGAIQATLLKKVEELTLYLIQENKKNSSLQKKIKS